MGISTTVLQAGQGTRTSKRALPTQHPAFLRIIQTLPHFFLTRSYFPCPQLLCPDLPGCPHSRTRLACLTGIWLETCEPEGAVSAESTGRNSPNRILNPATNQILLEFGFGEKDVDVDSTFGTRDRPVNGTSTSVGRFTSGRSYVRLRPFTARRAVRPVPRDGLPPAPQPKKTASVTNASATRSTAPSPAAPHTAAGHASPLPQHRPRRRL